MKRRVYWRIVALILGSILLIAMVLTAGLVAYEWTYIQRLRTYPKRPITSAGWHQPKEHVFGGGQAQLVPAGRGDAILDPAALQAAAHYAESKKSSALLVLHRDRLVLENYWQGFGPNQWSDSASMAKTLTALLIGIAIDEGHIPSVDEPAATYLPAWSRDKRRKITLLHLLQMNAGLRPMGKYDDPFSDACYLALGTDARYVVDHCPAVHEPGQVADYNNVNYQALGFVIEQATGQRFARYLSEKLWAPLGNRDAALWLDRPGGAARTFGFVFATAHDWARVGLLIQHGGKVGDRQVVPAEWIRRMTTPSRTDPAYGAGLYTSPDGDYPPFAAPDTVALNGHAKQRVYIIPSWQLVIVRIGENAKGWDDSRLPNLLTPALPVLEETVSSR